MIAKQAPSFTPSVQFPSETTGLSSPTGSNISNHIPNHNLQKSRPEHAVAQSNHAYHKSLAQQALQFNQAQQALKQSMAGQIEQAMQVGHSPFSPGTLPPVSASQNNGLRVMTNHANFNGGDVYVVNKGIIVGHKEKRYIRLKWGNGNEGHRTRWVGFAPSDWNINHDEGINNRQLLGFRVKPNLCELAAKSNKKNGDGWVTLSIDCERRAVKATIDGWTLGKVFIPMWLLGRQLCPVAVSENGTPVKFDLAGLDMCEKVERAGFRRWVTMSNEPLQILKCGKIGRSFETDVLGMSIHATFDDAGEVTSVEGATKMDYISYAAVDLGFAKISDEVIPLVINDHHAFRCEERGLWDLFYADDRNPLDYLCERLGALMSNIFKTKDQEHEVALARLAHFRHILFYLAHFDHRVVEDANHRVEWFLSNSVSSGAHKELTPSLRSIIICLAVSDYEWEDIAIPFFSEALERAIAEVFNGEKNLKWTGSGCASLEEMFEALMGDSNSSLKENLMLVKLFHDFLKPNTYFHGYVPKDGDDRRCLEKIRAEEFCCAIAGLSRELRIVMFERSTKKDEIKRCILKGTYQQDFPNPEIIANALDNSSKLRGILFRARMLAECHVTLGQPTELLRNAIAAAYNHAQTSQDFGSIFDVLRLEEMDSEVISKIIKKAVANCRWKLYIGKEDLSMEQALEVSNLPCARTTLRLNRVGVSILDRQGREPRIFESEVLPSFCELGNEKLSSFSSCSEGDKSGSNSPLSKVRVMPPAPTETVAFNIDSPTFVQQPGSASFGDHIRPSTIVKSIAKTPQTPNFNNVSSPTSPHTFSAPATPTYTYTNGQHWFEDGSMMPKTAHHDSSMAKNYPLSPGGSIHHPVTPGGTMQHPMTPGGSIIHPMTPGGTAMPMTPGGGVYHGNPQTFYDFSALATPTSPGVMTTPRAFVGYASPVSTPRLAHFGYASPVTTPGKAQYFQPHAGRQMVVGTPGQVVRQEQRYLQEMY